MIRRNGRSNGFFTLSSITGSYTTLSSGPGTTIDAQAGSRSENLENARELFDEFHRETRASCGGEGTRILEVEELMEWRYGGLGHLGISFFLFLLLGPGPVQMASAQVLPPPEIPSIGGGVSLCTGRSPWTVLLSPGTYETVQACMRVVSFVLIVLSSGGVLPKKKEMM